MGIVENFTRRPREPEAIALEMVLALAQEALEQADLVLLRSLVEELDTALATGIASTDLVRELRDISVLALAQGYEPYRVVLEKSDRYRIYVLDRRRWPQPIVLTAAREGSAWQLSGRRSGE